MSDIREKISRVLVAFSVALMLAILLSACSAGEAADTSTSVNPYAEEFDRLRTTATNDIQHTILEDDKITEAEIQEVTEMFKTCLKEHDVFFASYKYFRVDVAAEKPDLAEECRNSSVGELQSLYEMTVINPEKLENDELTYKCLLRRELIPKDLTYDEYMYYVDKHSGKKYEVAFGDDGAFIINDDGTMTPMEVDEYGNPQIPSEPLEYVEFPNGVSLDDSSLHGCSVDPNPESD
ncbi:MAG: hypothetical protein LBL41_01785 [Bifidobacteriaceae bacterium]|jgi:hypothetical protein|nr:hypothetical protein [Bifidobacteriaceae bacterium]